MLSDSAVLVVREEIQEPMCDLVKAEITARGHESVASSLKVPEPHRVSYIHCMICSCRALYRQGIAITIWDMRLVRCHRRWMQSSRDAKSTPHVAVVTAALFVKKHVIFCQKPRSDLDAHKQ